jgi:hypothetical protein
MYLCTPALILLIISAIITITLIIQKNIYNNIETSRIIYIIVTQFFIIWLMNTLCIKGKNTSAWIIVSAVFLFYFLCTFFIFRKFAMNNFEML